MPRLGDVCNIKSGYAFKSEMFTKNEIPIIRIGNITENGLEIDNDICFDESFWNENKNYRVNKDDVLVAMSGATVGKSCINNHSNKLLLNQRVASISGKNGVENKYVYYFVSSPTFMDYILEQSVGCAQPNISIKQLCAVEFYLPNLNAQKEIVGELDKVSNLIVLRRAQLSKLDELVKARFVEVFGDCENTVRLGDCCEVHARIGWQALTRDEHMKTGKYMLVTGTDFKDGEINYSTCVYVTKERFEMDKHIILKNNDVLITKDGTIGKVAIVHNLSKPATLNAGVFVVRPDERFNKEYIANVFKGPLFSDYVKASKTGATIKHLNQKHLVEFMIPVPSLEEQEAFARFTQQVDKSKFEVQQSLEKLETLKKSLMQQYFG